jgi:8-oxo-dGTP diphosphatase
MTTSVAVGILQRADGQVLLAQRPKGKPYEGWWEFPGGKCEPNETPAAALERELAEELQIQVLTKQAWLVQDFVYPHATVELHFFVVSSWQRAPVAAEGQQLAWRNPVQIDLQPLLPASIKVVQWLAWPQFVALADMPDSEINDAAKLLDTPIAADALSQLCGQTRVPVYLRGLDPQTGREGYLSSLVWKQA